VRDATVVTATIEVLGKFVAGQDVIGDLAWRLESLTVDQVNFLQLSAEPGLIQRALNRTETMKGAKVAALRKLLSDLAGGAIPEPVNRANPLVVPKGPILPPLTSLQPRPGPLSMPAAPAAAALSASPAAPPSVAVPPPAPVPAPPAAPPPATAPATAARPVEPAPVIEPVSVALPPLSADKATVTEPKLVRPEPAAASAPSDGAPEAPDAAGVTAPAHRQPSPPASGAPADIPRLGRQDAEARRARLLASLNDTLSSSEATP
jgi:hypothetical protein